MLPIYLAKVRVYSTTSLERPGTATTVKNRTAMHKRLLSHLPSYYGDFQNYLPKVVEKCLINNKYADSLEIKQRITNLCEYHTLAREPIQGKLALSAFHWSANPNDLTEHKLHQIKVLAWAVELVQSYYIIGDDVEDGSETRSGKPCWHLLPGVGSSAIHDASWLRSIVYEILKNNIDETILLQVANYFNEAYLTLDITQFLENSVSQWTDFNKFTMEYYEKCAYFEYMYYTIKFPILLALALCHKGDKESYQLIDDIFKDLAVLYKIENDLIDYIGYKSPSGKSSTDIQMKKCSWPALTVLQQGNVWQRRVFESCYGKGEPEKVERILDIYEELDLPNLYRQEEQKRYRAVNKKINDLPEHSIPSPQFCRQVVKFFQHSVLTTTKTTREEFQCS